MPKVTLNLPKHRIVSCSACGQDHKELVFKKEFNEIDGEAYTHVAECPTAQIPIYAREVLKFEVVHELVTAGGSYVEQLDALGSKILARAVIEHGWNVTEAAKALNMSRQNLHTLLKRHGIKKPGTK